MRGLAVLAVAVVLVAGCSDGGEETATEPAVEEDVIRGVLVLLGGAEGDVGDCAGDGGFSDVGPGTGVTVRSGDGEIVGTGDLESADEDEVVERMVAADDTATESEVRDLIGQGGEWFCPLTYDIEVADADFYEVEIGRRDFTISRSELESADWVTSHTLNGL